MLCSNCLLPVVQLVAAGQLHNMAVVHVMLVQIWDPAYCLQGSSVLLPSMKNSLVILLQPC
jgi:hypothetical protein